MVICSITYDTVDLRCHQILKCAGAVVSSKCFAAGTTGHLRCWSRVNRGMGAPLDCLLNHLMRLESGGACSMNHCEPVQDGINAC